MHLSFGYTAYINETLDVYKRQVYCESSGDAISVRRNQQLLGKRTVTKTYYFLSVLKDFLNCVSQEKKVLGQMCTPFSLNASA